MTKLSETQKEIITGLLLGDGHLSIGGRAKNPRLRINRSAVDEEYAVWIANHFKKFTSDKALRKTKVFDRRNGKHYNRISFNTLRNEAFLENYESWYRYTPNKKIPSNIVFTPLTLAVWFADDGSFYKRSSGGHEITFATQSFSEKEVDFLLSYLKTISPEFKKFGNYKNSGQYKIVGNSKAARSFLGIVDSVFPPMNRKSTLWRNGSFDILKTIPLCPICDKNDFVFKNGLYYGRKEIPQAQKMKCSNCGARWKIPLFKGTS